MLNAFGTATGNLSVAGHSEKRNTWTVSKKKDFKTTLNDLSEGMCHKRQLKRARAFYVNSTVFQRLISLMRLM